METIQLACAAEGSYVAHSAAMIDSVLSHRGSLGVHVHYLHGSGFASTDADRLAAMVEAARGSISFLEVTDARLADLPHDARFTSAMWLRLFLPELLPGCGRALYLDVDTLACDSLEPLWRTDLSGCRLAAVTNAFQPNHRARAKRLGLPSPDVYFNSGVLLMDLDGMRHARVTDSLLEVVAARRSELEWPDQDALNLVLYRERLPLHPRWNAMNALYREWSRDTFGRLARVRARRRPGIRHFEGPDANKPWHPDCREPQRELYWEHLGRTPWGSSVSA